uniref:Uncharacterized protein n=1 Tax=Angiostrongylus cantonensis TaxID=6313 RepID=A0A0K0D3F4_ANGCA
MLTRMRSMSDEGQPREDASLLEEFGTYVHVKLNLFYCCDDSHVLQSCNFVKLQQLYRDETRKKNQYKQDLQRLKVEYKKKCEEAVQLRAKIANISSRPTSISDVTHDPFRTPITGRVPQQRSFITSTPYNRTEDLTEATTFATNQTDSSASFSAAGIPLVSLDSGGEVLKLYPLLMNSSIFFSLIVFIFMSQN